METFKLTLYIFGIIIIIIGFVQIYFRIKHIHRFENKTDNVISFVFGRVWFPLPLPMEKSDTDEQRKLKKKINTLVKLFYILFIIGFVGLLVYVMMKGNM